MPRSLVTMPAEQSKEPARTDGSRDFLTVDGMFCAACAASVEAVINRHPAVSAASVNFAADAAVVDWQPDASDRKGLLAKLRSLGYHARMIGDDSGASTTTADPTRDLVLRLVVALFFGMWAMLPSVTLYFDVVSDPAARLGLAWAAGVFSLPVVLFSGIPFFRMGFNTLRYGVAGVDALILLGVAGSLLLSVVALASDSAEVFFEVAVALITLQLVARLLDLRVRRRARDAVISLFDLAPTEVRVLDSTGSEQVVALNAVRAGQQIRVRPGERIAVDGKLIAGSADVDRSLISGESIPAFIEAPARVYAGERVLDGVMTIEVTATNGKRRIDELGRQVRQMLAEKPAWQRTVDSVAGKFLWLAGVTAVLGAVIVTASGGGVYEASVRALTVFVIACPCALALAAPLAGLAASGAAAQSGIILRDLNAIAAAAVPDRLFLDKTGTVTVGLPTVTAVHAVGGFDEAQVLAIAAMAERDADHPVARGIESAHAESAGGGYPLRACQGHSRVIPGRGVVWTDNDAETRVGQVGWLADDGVAVPVLPPTCATRVGVARDGRFIGAIDLDDEVRPGMRQTVDVLRARGIEIALLSGDAEGPVARAANALGICGVAGLTPEDKTKAVSEARERGVVVAFAGDGVNDAPALAAADLGVAVGWSTDAARTAAAVAFVDADASSLPRLFGLTAQARRVVRQNLVGAVLYNAVAIPAAILGWVHPAIAAVAMAFSSITVVLNGLRAGRSRTG